MSEIGEIFAATKEQRKHDSQKRKANNMVGSEIMLKKNGIEFERKNDGVHLYIEHKGRKADFWPSTGKFNIRGDNRYFRGVNI